MELYKTHLCPLLHQELPRFKELIFEDFSRFLLVENMFEEVVLQSVSKDIMMGEELKQKYLETTAAVTIEVVVINDITKHTCYHSE